MSDAKQQLIKVAQEFLSEGDRVVLVLGSHRVSVTSLGMGDDNASDLAVAQSDGRAFVFDPADLIAVESRAGADGVVVL